MAAWIARAEGSEKSALIPGASRLKSSMALGRLQLAAQTHDWIGLYYPAGLVDRCAKYAATVEKIFTESSVDSLHCKLIKLLHF